MIFRSSKYIINIWGPEHLIKYDEYTSLQPVDENLWYFKLILFDQTEFISLKIETSNAKIYYSENQSLCQALDSFIIFKNKIQLRNSTKKFWKLDKNINI